MADSTANTIDSAPNRQDQNQRDIEAIKQLKARYFRLIDTKQWEQLRQVFTDDCVFDRTSTVATGPDAFVAGVEKNLGPIVSVHHGHMPEIVLTSPTTARGIWAMVDELRWELAAEIPDFLRGDPAQTGLTGYGHYEEEYRKSGDTWRISMLRLTRIALTPHFGEHARLPSVWPRATPNWLPGPNEGNA
jgi:hypothetical protein